MGQRPRIAEAVGRCRDAGIEVALFLDPEPAQIEASLGARAGCHRAAHGALRQRREGHLARRSSSILRRGGQHIVAAGLQLHAGHGLNYRNVRPIARLDRMAELNIGHSIVSRAVFVGLEAAVQEMKVCMGEASPLP